MNCPKCHGKGWQPSQGERHHLENIGGKVILSSSDIRRYLCRNCGYVFKTKESFLDDYETEPQSS